MKIIADAFPWELTIQIGGNDYPTVPITVADLLRDIDAPSAEGDRPSDAARISATIAAMERMFPDHCRPDLRSLDWGDLVTIRLAYQAYAADRIKKKQQRISQTIAQESMPQNPAGLVSADRTSAIAPLKGS